MYISKIYDFPFSLILDSEPFEFKVIFTGLLISDSKIS